MAIPVTVPKATITLEEANILSWRKLEGEYVQKDEILFEMETDKVVVEVPSPADGFLLRIGVKEGVAKVGQAIAWLGASGEMVPEEGGLFGPAIAMETPVVRKVAAESEGLAASPAARRRARELGLNLANIRGTGPGARITEGDVERAGRGE